MLTRDFKHNDPKTIQENIRLIAARKTIEASLDKYLDRVRKEFMVATRRYQRHSLQVNTRSEDAMTKEEIRQGIEL